MSYFPSRITRIRQRMAECELDAFYIRLTSNILWATSFSGVFDEEQAHALLILPDRVILHSDSRYYLALCNAAKDTDITIDITRKHHFSLLLDVLKENNSKCGALRIGIEDSLSLREFRVCEAEVKTACETENSFTCSLVEMQGFIESLRTRKDKNEIELMKQAQSITDKAFEYIVSFVKPGMTEKQVQLELDNALFRFGAEGLAFPSIVASGARGAKPHSIPSEEKIMPGECVVMDFGARYGGYCSDMTRTVFIGEPSEKMKRAWNTLVEANETCESSIRAGVIASEVHNKAEAILEKNGFGSTMGHSLGHSVGIDIHEEPNLSPRNNKKLEEGNVVTVEPGIYLSEEFGMRLEDFGVVTQEGFEVITQSSHEMVIIEPHE